MQRRFWGGDPVPVGIPSLNILRLPSKRLRNRHLAWGENASKSSFERTIAAVSLRSESRRFGLKARPQQCSRLNCPASAGCADTQALEINPDVLRHHR